MTDEFLKRLFEARATLVPDLLDGASSTARHRLQLFCYWLAKAEQAWDDPALDLDAFAAELRRMRFSEAVVSQHVCTIKDRIDDLCFGRS